MKNGMKNILRLTALSMLLALSWNAAAQKYQGGLVDKTIAVVGNEMISLSQLEGEIMSMRVYGNYNSDKNVRSLTSLKSIEDIALRPNLSFVLIL